MTNNYEMNAKWADHSTMDSKDGGGGGGYVRQQVEAWESYSQALWWDVRQANVGPANFAQGTYVQDPTKEKEEWPLTSCSWQEWPKKEAEDQGEPTAEFNVDTSSEDESEPPQEEP